VLSSLTLILLTWRIWWASNNASKWQMGFNSMFKGLMYSVSWTRRLRYFLCSGSTTNQMLLWPVFVCLFHLIFYVYYIFWPNRSHHGGSFIQLNTCFIMCNFYVLCDTHFESFRAYQDMQQISQTWKTKTQGRTYIFIW